MKFIARLSIDLMINLDDIKKLYKLQQEGYYILCNNDRVHIAYDDSEFYLNEEDRYNFTFLDDKYNIVCFFDNYRSVKWAVQKVEEVDWRHL